MLRFSDSRARVSAIGNLRRAPLGRIYMSDLSTSNRQQSARERFLSGEIDKQTYDALLADLQAATSASVVSESLIVELSSAPSEVIIATSDPESRRAPLDNPVALVGPGIDLGGFRIEKRLGRGGMGEVWRAKDLVGERTVVIKLLHPEFVHNPEELASVKEVFQRVHRLQHQNICPLYLLGHDSQFGYYVVMKHIDGLTLSVYRRRHLESHDRFTVRDVVRVLGPVAQALDYAHSQKIVHCDVKPQNIMLGPEGPDGLSVQLVDFGLAAEIRSSVSRISSTPVEYGGTHPYMSPEQWRGETLEGKTDQYALAVVAYELLAGHRPFHSADPAVLRMCALNEVPPAIEGIDATVNSALIRGMAKSKSDRFPTCQEFINAMSESAGHRTPTPSSRRSGNHQPNDDINGEFTQTMALSESAEARIAQANRKAAIWLGRIAGTTSIAVVGLMLWGASHFFISKQLTQIRGLSTQTVAADQSLTNNVIVATPAPAHPVPVEPLLRYRWQTDRAYLYSVSLDIDQDQDRVLTLSGELAYSARSHRTTPISPDGETKGTGTAFLVHPDGYFITCHHVTDGATSIEVAINDRSYPASLVAEDADHDLALIRVESKGLPDVPLALSDSDAVQQGEEVRAVGFPLSSILGENIKATRGTIAGINIEENRKVFQIDAAINPGNSGGPLVDEKGEVVGVIYAKLVDDIATSVGFATPINDARNLLQRHSIAYTAGQTKERLDGPSLVKKVSAATALVTVTSRGAHSKAKGRVSLGCDGTLKPKSWRRSGLPEQGLDSSGQSRELTFSSTGAGPDTDRIETDAAGRIYSVTGRGYLPNFLGQGARIIVETLPPSRQKTWSVSYPVTLRLEQTATRKGGPPWGPGFGPRRFGRTIPFGPGQFGPPDFGDPISESTTKECPGRMQIDYVLGERAGTRQTIQKSFEMKTDEILGAGPRIQLKGQGHFVINTETGLPEQIKMSAQLIENGSEKSTSTPMTLTCQFLEQRALVPGQDHPQAIPPAVTTPGKPVETDSPLEVGARLVGEWSGKWQRVTVLALKDDGQVRIHWEGWSDQWDEDVPRSRLRFLTE